MPSPGESPYALTDERRQTARRLARTLIPDSPMGPSAEDIAVADVHLDRTLSLRPDLVHRFEAILDSSSAADPREFLEALSRDQRAEFEVFTLLVAGAYFLDETVRSWLGYRGQIASPDPGPQPGEPTEEQLVRHVQASGKAYRPTDWTGPLHISHPLTV